VVRIGCVQVDGLRADSAQIRLCVLQALGSAAAPVLPELSQ
jgi:hypothetical protein